MVVPCSFLVVCLVHSQPHAVQASQRSLVYSWFRENLALINKLSWVTLEVISKQKNRVLAPNLSLSSFFIRLQNLSQDVFVLYSILLHTAPIASLQGDIGVTDSKPSDGSVNYANKRVLILEQPDSQIQIFIVALVI